MEEINTGLFVDPTNNSFSNSGNVFSDWFYPADKEVRQMNEQLTMEQLSPQARMAGLKAAGINPLTAASAVAGANVSSPQPSASANPIGDVASGLAPLAPLAEAGSTLTKLSHEIPNIDAATSKIRSDEAKNFADIGLTNAETQGVLTDNTYKDEDWRSRLNVQRQQFTNMKQEFANLQATHSQILEDINLKKSQISLNGSIQDMNEVNTSLLNENVRWQKELNDFRIDHKLFINESGIDGYIWNMCLTGQDIDQFDKFVDIYSRFRGEVQSAQSKAEYEQQANYAYSIANAQETARSLNQIVTDWNTPASGLWSLIEKIGNLSGNRSGKNNIGSALEAKDNPDEYAGYCQLMVGLNLSLSQINKEIESAAAANNFNRVRELTSQKNGLQSFIREMNFDEYKKHMHRKQ